MKTPEMKRSIRVLFLMSLSAVAACGKGGTSTVPVVSGGPSSPAVSAGGTSAVIGAARSAAAISAQVIQPAQLGLRELEAEKGGVSGPLALSTADTKSAAKVGAGALGGGKPSSGGGSASSGFGFPNVGKSAGGGSGSGSSSGAGGQGGGLSSAGIPSSSAATEAAAKPAAPAGDSLSTVAIGRSGGGGGGSGGGGFGGLFGSGGNDGLSGESRSEAFGLQPGDVRPLGSEDPGDYFARLGLGDDLFKIVERRYRNQAGVWARADAEGVTSRSRAP